MPVPVVVWSKASVGGHSLPWIVGSNLARGMYVCPLWVLCVVRLRSLRRADLSSRGVLPSVVCLTECERESSIMGRPWRTGVLRHSKKITYDQQHNLTLILRRSRAGMVWFYTSTSNKRAARPKLYTKSLTRDLKRMYSRLTLVRISINL